mmetsp:Transcript_16001/g.20233  ORF Transcript_16001/g.20233 Transcript_16001/m.20233 type:complete len:267 (-) Transcript_16001:86-886(-)
MADVENPQRQQDEREAFIARDTDNLLGNEADKSSKGEPEDPINMLAGKDVEDRLGFIRKVYAILSVMLTFTFGCIAMTKSVADLNDWIRDQWTLALVAALLTIPVLITLFCFIKVARTVPINFILLSMVTGLETFVLMFITSRYTEASIVVAAAMTLAVTIALTIYAFNTDTDFTAMTSAIITISIVAFMMSLAFIFIPSKSPWSHVLAAGFVLIYSFYLVWHTQLIAGGKKEELTLDDYVIGAVILYLDIMYMFVYILKLVGSEA